MGLVSKLPSAQVEEEAWVGPPAPTQEDAAQLHPPLSQCRLQGTPSHLGGGGLPPSL